MRPTLLFIIGSVLCATASTASAQLYKWVDDKGVVNYGDWPPGSARLQPVNRGTLNSVSDSVLVAPAARAPAAPRNAPQPAAPGVSVRNDAASSNAPASNGDATYDGSYTYNGYPWRPVAAEAVADRRPGNAPTRPLLPIDPAIPEMPLRPRR